MEKYGYIYKITNLINSKVYIGQHCKSSLDENYWGSGCQIKRAIAKYSQDNFTRCIIDWGYDKEDLDNKEIFWIAFTRETCSRDLCYNVLPGGQGCGKGIDNHFFGKHHSDESKEKNRQKHLGFKHTDEARRKISEAGMGRIFTQSSKDKISKALMGRIMSDEWKRNLSEAHKDIKQSQETIDKRMKTIKDRYPDGVPHNCPEHAKQRYRDLYTGRRAINNGIIWTYLQKDEELPKDFIYGRKRGLKYVRSL